MSVIYFWVRYFCFYIKFLNIIETHLFVAVSTSSLCSSIVISESCLDSETHEYISALHNFAKSYEKIIPACCDSRT